MLKKRGVNVKEWVMFGMGLLISILGGFSAYVVNDVREDTQAVRNDIAIIREKYDEKFDNFSVAYMLKADHERDFSRLDSKVDFLTKEVEKLKK